MNMHELDEDESFFWACVLLFF